MKCEVPSFVSDFVVVENWKDSQGNTYLPGENFGKETEKVAKPSKSPCIPDVMKRNIQYFILNN